MTLNSSARGAALVALVAIPFGCREKADPPPAPETKAATAEAKAAPPKAAPEKASPPSKGPAVPDARTPLEFAHAWAAVRTAPIEQRGQRGLALARSVDNRIFTWSGYAIAGLCIDATRTCALNVFGTADVPDAAALRGFFPQVGFTPEGWAAIKTGCAGQSACVVTFEGTVKEVVTDPAEPIRLIFGDAVAQSARAPKTGDPWFERKAAKAPAVGKTPALGTSTAGKTRIQVKPKTF